MLQAAIYARLARDPEQRTTKSGKPMTAVRVAVEVGKDAEDQQTLWCDILAFGRNADELARLSKGAIVSAIGRMTRSTWTDRDGNEREQWALVADGLLSTKTPPPRRSEAAAAYEASRRFQAPPADFDTECPF
jgi:single-strand DNA-binding protein